MVTTYDFEFMSTLLWAAMMFLCICLAYTIVRIEFLSRRVEKLEKQNGEM